MKPRLLLLIVVFAISTVNSRSFLNPFDLPLPPPHEGTSNGHIHELNVNHFLYQISKNDVEGYSEMIKGSEFYSYPSLREDINISMIARATTGEMGFEFLSGQIPENYAQDEISFFFLSDIDLNLREPFDLFLEDELILTFNSKEDGTLDIISNPGAGKVEFYLIKRDANNDGIGAFRITVPTAKVKKGGKAKFRFTGHRKGSNCWLMIFKAKDVVQRLKKSVSDEAAFMIKENEGELHIDAPAHFSGKSVFVISDGKKSTEAVFKKQGELAKATVTAQVPKNSFTIHYGDQSLEVNFPNGDGTISTTDIEGEYFHHFSASFGSGWKASVNKLYKPDFYNTYTNFFKKKYDKGVVSLMNSSHQDIAWVDRPEICIILRDTLLLTPVINDAFVRSDYGFDIEDGLILREYMERHPDAKDKITELLNKKLLSVGATYNCPYEDMYDAEDQVRQLYLGKKWVKKTFGGYDSKVYWNVDVPGKTLQLPQILKKAGVEYMVISRHAKGMFNWESPDGSSVFTYSPGHYGNDLLYLDKDLNTKMKYGAQQVLYWEKNFSKNNITTPLLSSQDMLPAIDYSEFIDSWNGFKSMKDVNGKEKKVYLPNMELMTMDEFFPLVKKNADQIQTIKGERPNVWVYIHGPSHHDALTASRQASKLLPAAEKFLSVAHVLDPARMPYPFEEFDEAWQAKIYPDHGWGGHDGDITDDLFKESFVKSRFLGEGLLNKGVDFIASHVDTDEKQGIPVVLFNSLSWERTDPVTISLTTEKGKARSFTVVSPEGEEIQAQLSNTVKYDDGSVKTTDLTFVAESIPSIGYKTYYVRASDKNEASAETAKEMSNTYENDHYKLTFASGGIEQIYDKELGKNLFDTNKFKAGEVFTMRSVGNGAGEFGDIQQPSMENFDRVANYSPEWKLIEQGDVYTKYRLRQQILHAIVQQDVTVYHQLKRVQFNTELRNWSGELYREFRTAFPLEMSNPQVAHEVPFGRVRVGIDEIKTAGERYTPLCKDVHPRAIIDWISSSDETTEVTLSSSVAAADWIDPTSEHRDDRVMLQHVLLASRTSCHFNGNKYSQEGHHAYEHVLTSHKKGDIQGQRIAKQQNEPIKAVVYPTQAQGSNLPETLSFFSIDQENVMVTTVKKAEDNDNLIVRMYDAVGQESTVKLKSHFDLDGMNKTNIIEENPVSVPELQVGKYSIETFSLELSK